MKSWTQHSLADLSPLSTQQFMQMWIGQMSNSVLTPKDRHQRRIQMITTFKEFNVELGGQSKSQFALTCQYSKGKITNPFESFWLEGCDRYHTLSILALFQSNIKGKEANALKQIPCPFCQKGIIRSTKDFKLNMIVYQFFNDLEQEGKGTLRITPKALQNQQLGQVPRLDSQTIMKNDKKLLTFKIDNEPKEFTSIIAQDPLLNQLYNRIEAKDIDETIWGRMRQGFVERIILICPWSKKRILYPISHKKCQHEEVVLFDLYSLIIAFQERTTKINCPMCSSEFTFDNLQADGFVDAKIRECVKKESLCYTNVYIERREYKPKYQATIRDLKFTNDQRRQEIQRRIRLFFKSDHKKKIEAGLKVLNDKCNGPQQIDYKLSEVAIPVRCTKCQTPKALDVWDFYHQTENQKKCPICEVKHKESTAFDKMIYFDFKLWEYTRLSIKNLIFFPAEKIYSPTLDIDEVKFLKIVRNQKKKIQKYHQSTTNFQIKANLPGQLLKHAIPIVLRSCLKPDLKGNDIYVHIIFKTSELKFKDLECPTCRKKPASVEDLVVDQLLKDNLEKGSIKLEYDSALRNYKERMKIGNITTFNELLAAVKKQECYEIGKNVKLNLQTKNNTIKQPVIIKNCVNQGGVRDHIMDLIDVFGELGQKKLDYCPLCRTEIEYVDQILYLPSIKKAIEKLQDDLNRKGTPERIKNGVLCNQVASRQHELSILTGQGPPPPNVYDRLRESEIDGKGGIRLKKDKYKPFMRQLEEDFKERFAALPGATGQKEGPYNLPQPITAGGVFISNFKPIARFNPSI